MIGQKPPNWVAADGGPLRFCPASCVIIASRSTRLNPWPLDDRKAMLEIHVDSALDPRFRIVGATSDPRIVVFMVQDHRGKAVWVVTPPGTTVSQHDPSQFMLVERREATAEDRKNVDAIAARTLGDRGVLIAMIEYGVVPDGLAQAVPAGMLAPGLRRGERYEAVVVSSHGDVASAEFVADEPVV